VDGGKEEVGVIEDMDGPVLPSTGSWGAKFVAEGANTVDMARTPGTRGGKESADGWWVVYCPPACCGRPDARFCVPVLRLRLGTGSLIGSDEAVEEGMKRRLWSSEAGYDIFCMGCCDWD